MSLTLKTKLCKIKSKVQKFFELCRPFEEIKARILKEILKSSLIQSKRVSFKKRLGKHLSEIAHNTFQNEVNSLNDLFRKIILKNSLTSL